MIYRSLLELHQLLPQGSSFPAQHGVFRQRLILGQLCPGCICDVVLDLAAHILGAAGALAVFVQIIHRAEHRRLGHREVIVGVQQLCDILVQLFGKTQDVFFRICGGDGIRCARDVDPYLVYHGVFPFFILYLYGARPFVLLFYRNMASFPVTFRVRKRFDGVSRPITTGITPRKAFRCSVLPSIII
mgnify:CR=1 FL=1